MSSPDGSGPIEWVQWFLTTGEGPAAYIRDVLTSAGAVLLVGLFLFGVSGVWPPLVAVESGSMNPHLQKGDLVFVMEEHRFAPEETYEQTGVVTTDIAEEIGYQEFSQSGDVIVYRPDGNEGRTPIIHRARFWVNDSENWYDEANEKYLGGADSCETDDDPETDTALENCPALHGGFITKGDANSQYDQVAEISEPVRPRWIVGTAEFRIPYLGWIRLGVSRVLVLNCTALLLVEF